MRAFIAALAIAVASSGAAALCAQELFGASSSHDAIIVGTPGKSAAADFRYFCAEACPK